jgi:glycine cleavage system H protein
MFASFVRSSRSLVGQQSIITRQLRFASVTKYTKDHEWVRVEKDIGTVGISDFAQNQLGDVVYVDLPSVGDKFKQKDTLAAVESVKV